jgi:hypothetical protein
MPHIDNNLMREYHLWVERLMRLGTEFHARAKGQLAAYFVQTATVFSFLISGISPMRWAPSRAGRPGYKKLKKEGRALRLGEG